MVFAEWLLSGIKKKVEFMHLIRQENVQKAINKIEVIYSNALLWMWSEWWIWAKGTFSNVLTGWEVIRCQISFKTFAHSKIIM